MSMTCNLVILLLLLLVNFGQWRITCYAQGTSNHLKAGDQLNHTNPTICSAGGTYCMKFLPIDSDSPFYYLVVYNVFIEVIVWIANRNDKVLHVSSEALTLDHSGVLKIIHQGQEPTILYSPAGLPQHLINNTTATLLDTGNFVLQLHQPNGSKIVLWQSFDFPTDTLLPGMKLGINHKTGTKWSLVSYSNYLSAAPGPITLEWEPRTRQLIILHRGKVYWASGVVKTNGLVQNFSEEDQGLYNFTIVSNKDEEYFTYSPWDDETKMDKISTIWSIHLNGQLNDISHVLANSSDCYGNTRNGGCQLLDQPDCRHKDEFFGIMKVRVRDLGITYSTVDNSSLSITDCQATCWNTCQCVGFTSYNNSDGSGCVFYYKNSHMSAPQDNILRLYFLANRSEPRHEGGPAQAPSPGQMDQYQDSNASAKGIKLLIAIITTTLFIICTVLWVLIRRRKIMLEGNKRIKMEEGNGVRETLKDPAKLNELLNYKKDGHALKLFSYASIIEATDNFSLNNKLGQGGFGPVYKGKLQDGKEVAIKKLSRSSRQGVIEFKNELTLISELQHRNLVQLLGCCIQGEERILVYEFMPHKSLDFFLFDSTKSKLLDWKTRFNIIEGIVQGLLYLHQYSRLRIVHRDLKASNILLDEKMIPKISDFGLARIIAQESEGNIDTNRIVGTFGYMPPEYMMKGLFSTKSDIYSFGILMLEIVSGRRNNSFYNADNPINLVGHAWELWKVDAAATLELVDPAIKDSFVEDQVLRCIHISLLCAEERPIDRPTMSEILSMLTKESSKLPFLKRPAFCSRDHCSAAHEPVVNSTNGLSISDIFAR